jgi:hypothetical protein
MVIVSTLHVSIVDKKQDMKIAIVDASCGFIVLSVDVV